MCKVSSGRTLFPPTSFTTMTLTLDRATVISTTLEGIMYGVSVFMYGVTVWALLAVNVNRPMLMVATILFICTTMHLGINIHRLLFALFERRSYPRGGSSGWLNDPSQWTYLAKDSILFIQNLTADSIVVCLYFRVNLCSRTHLAFRQIYRCYVVWNSWQIIVIPVLMVLSLLGVGISTVIAASRVHLSQGDIYSSVTKKWITTYFSLTLATNSLSTLLLVYRIWQINNRVDRYSQRGASLKSVALTILDSALVYWAVILTTLVGYVVESIGQYVVLDMIVPSAAIAFYAIFIRIAFSNTKGIGSSKASTTIRSALQSGPRPPVKISVSELHERKEDNEVFEMDMAAKGGNSSGTNFSSSSV
ncbi:hypothetical protein OF83DRAFT_760633 [Amylostereum chailletii]|nr:hypothetical protein OF83DRAFT_760633 [Amylostereum chailletii]